MTDKQIIIDGVDVSGCEYYNKYDKTCREVNGNYDTDICEFDKCENSNCYYKQLKRKEQECEELKEEIKTNGFGCFNIEMSEQLDQLKKTLAEIKEICRFNFTMTTTNLLAKTILQKISECEVENEIKM